VQERENIGSLSDVKTNLRHIDPNAPEGDDGKDMFFRFEKRIVK